MDLDGSADDLARQFVFNHSAALLGSAASKSNSQRRDAEDTEFAEMIRREGTTEIHASSCFRLVIPN
jgi:hypothetical protein